MPEIPSWLITPLLASIAAWVVRRDPPFRYRWFAAAGLVILGIFGPAAVIMLRDAHSTNFALRDFTPVPAAGRVVVAEAGYAVTLPDGWRYRYPTVDDERKIVEQFVAADPEGASELAVALDEGVSDLSLELDGGGGDLLLIAFGPIPDGAEATYEQCNIFDEPMFGLAIDRHVDVLVATLELFRDRLKSGPDVTHLTLPAGDAVRVDTFYGEPDGQNTNYLISRGDTLVTLTCSDRAEHSDHWLSIAETFEFVMPTGTQAGDTSAGASGRSPAAPG